MAQSAVRLTATLLLSVLLGFSTSNCLAEPQWQEGLVTTAGTVPAGMVFQPVTNGSWNRWISGGQTYIGKVPWERYDPPVYRSFTIQLSEMIYLVVFAPDPHLKLLGPGSRVRCALDGHEFYIQDDRGKPRKVRVTAQTAAGRSGTTYFSQLPAH